MSNKPVNVSVKMGGKVRSIEQLIRTFMRLCKQEKIVDEVRRRSFHKSKGQKRREKKAAGKRRHERQQDENKLKKTRKK